MFRIISRCSSVRVKLAGAVLLLTLPAILVMYICQLPMTEFVVGFLSLVAAWMGGEFFVRRQVKAMSASAEKIADGDLTARTGLPDSADELGQLARIFDRMAEALEQRNTERERTEKILRNRAMEQTVVAALGQFALTNGDLDALLDQAVQFIAQTLDVEFAAAFKRLPDGQLLLLAGTGWNSGHVGHATFPGDDTTQAGFTLNSGEPAVSKDFKTETRFTASPLLNEHGIVSGVTIVIPARGQSFGVLGVYSKLPRGFNSDEIQFLMAVVGVIGMAADHLNLGEQLRQSQKMESVGQLAAGVAHDFNNILTIIQGHSSVLLAKSSLPSEVIDSVQAIFFAAERAAGLTRQLLMFSRKNIMQTRQIDLREVVGNMNKMLARLLGETITLQFHPPARLPSVQGDAGMIEQIIMNLAVNARDAMSDGGKLTVVVESVAIDAAYVETHSDACVGNFVRLCFADNGTGMDSATLRRIFEPFFTTKEVGKGTGLGLATVYGIVKQHEGWIEVASEPGKGTAFYVFFPASNTEVEPERKNETDTPVVGGTETILLVEDEPVLLEMARTILQGYGYKILEASTGREAMAVWHRCAGQIDLLLTDMVMPDGVSGLDLVEKLLADRPDLKVVFTSGYSPNEIKAELITRSQGLFLQKPYTHNTLASTVRDCIDKVAANNNNHNHRPSV